MKFLKESLLKFNTYTQIQIGVIGVASCIFFISVCLLSIISLILINTTYTEIQAMLELKENDQINGVSIYIDTQINIATELSKIYQFNIRAFINNNLKNMDFINNFKGEKYKNYIAPYNTNESSTKKYLYERCFADAKNPEYENIQKIFTAYLQVIEYTQNNKYYSNNDDRMFKLFSYYNNESKCILYFPKIEFNESYDIKNFETFILAQTGLVNMGLDHYIDNYKLNREKKNLAFNIGHNPLILGYASNGNLKDLKEFYKTNLPGLLNLITISIKFKENFVNRNNITNPNNHFSTTNPFVYNKEIKDFLVTEFSDTMVDKLLIKNLIRFPAFKTIVFNGKLIGKSSCGIMRNIYNFYNKITNKTNNPQSLETDKHCFLFKNKRENKSFFEDYFYPSKNSSNYINLNSEVSEDLRRFVKIPFAYDSKYPKSVENAINYKVLKFRAADVTTRILINSFFTVWLRPHVYILKNYSFISNNFRIIYIRFLSTQLKIISVNILISIVTGAIVVLLTFRVSKSIGDPISKLISIVKNINPQKDKKKNKNKNKNKKNTLNRNYVLPDADNKENKDFSGVDNINNEKELADKDPEKGENSDNAEGNSENERDDEENDENENNENTQMKSEATENNTEVLSKENNLNNIKFPDDDTINKFFNICKNLIKGGLADETLKVKQMHYNDEAYNNISFMKSNNLIVQEEKILRETESRSDIIFSHKSLIERIKNFTINNNITNNNSINQEFLSQVSNSENLININNNNNPNFNFKNLASSQKTYNPNSNANIIVNSKNGDEIEEIVLERQKKIDKSIRNILGPNKHMHSLMSDSPQKLNIFSGSEYSKIKYETVDLYPTFKDKKNEFGLYFQNTKNVNMINLSYDNINFMLHAKIEKKKSNNAENNLFSEESEFDKVVGKHFTKENLDKVFEFLKHFSN